MEEKKTNDLNSNSEKEKVEQESQKVEPENEAKEELKQVTLSQAEYDGIKLQMAKVINDYKDLERDLENYRKRSRQEIDSAKLDGMIKALETILPTLDTFKKAKKVIRDKDTLDGVNMIEKGILEALKKLNVNKIECVGKKFDPNFHNAVLSISDANHKAGTVIEEIEAGYTLGDKVIKFSQVVVAK